MQIFANWKTKVVSYATQIWMLQAARNVHQVMTFLVVFATSQTESGVQMTNWICMIGIEH